MGAALGGLGLFGWVTGTSAFTTIVPGQPPMVPNTAVALLLLGVAGALLRERVGSVRRTLSLVLAIVVLVIGVVTLAEYALGVVTSGIDQLVLPSGAGPHAGRPSPPTAFALSLLGGALLFLDYRPSARARPSEWLILCAALIALAALLGQLLGAGPFYRLSSTPVIGVAVPTALSLLFTSAGLLLERPDAGFMRVATSPGPGGRMLRRLVPAAALAPAVLGVVVVRLLAILGVEDLPRVATTLAVVMTVAGLFLIAVTAVPLERTHEALELSRAQSRDLIEHASDGIFVADLAGRYTAVNSAGCRMLGYACEEIVGKTIMDLIPPEDVERLAESKAQLEAGGTHIGEWTLRRKDGTNLPVEVNAKIIRGGRWQGIVRDISERKRVEDEQRFLAEVGSVLATTLEYEDTLSNIARLVVRHLADVCIVDILEDSGEVRRLKVVSRDPSKAAACELMMHQPVDSERSALLRSILEDWRPVLMEKLTRETVASWARSEEHLRALRDLDPRSLIVVPLVARGKLLGVVSLVSTTSSRIYGPADVRFAEEVAGRAALSLENARLYRAAQRATQARDDVLAVVAHDLRNPLGIILMQATLLRRREREGEPERRSRRPVEAIERAATRMTRLLRDLLDATRMDAGSFSIDPARVPPAQVVADSVEAQMVLASSASIELRVDVAPDLPDVWADRDRLLQVFENLIGNAVKFTEPGGRITVGAAPRGDDSVLFWVADTGVGVAAEHLPHLFDRFWQAGKVGHRGAGLGLGIVKGIVEAHGGHISVESTPGQGTIFFLTIPTRSAVP